MLSKNYLKTLKILTGLSLASLLIGCSSLQEIIPVEVKTVEVKRKIPLQGKPKPMQMNSLHFYVVTPDNIDKFKKVFEKENGNLVFYAISVRDYENLSLNISELDRYLKQQNEIIVYYEKAITK